MVENKINLVCLAAGAGARLSDSGKIKPLIDICGKSMLERVVLNIFNTGINFIFCFLKEHEDNYKLSEIVKINQRTLYDVLKRLKFQQIINIKSNNRYSVITICNWSKYQSTMTQSNDNKMTTNRQQNDTLQELRIENKKEIIKKEKFSSLKKAK